MEPTLILIFLLLFFACAVSDYRKKVIPDILTSLMWIFIAFTGELFVYFTVLFFFGITFFANSVAALIKKPFAGWGDVLIFPIFVGVISSLVVATEDNTYFLAVPFALLLAIVDSYITKQEKVALTPYFFIAIFISAVVALTPYFFIAIFISAVRFLLLP